MKNLELLDSIEPSQIKAAFFDVDGTLVNRDYEISSQTCYAISELKRQNITVSLATGRPYFGATKIMSELEVNGLSLFYSGALIVEPHQGKPLFSKAIEPKILQTLIEEVSQKKLYCVAFGIFLVLIKTASLKGKISLPSVPEAEYQVSSRLCIRFL